MSLIRFKEVSHAFGDKPVLDKVSLTIAANQRVGLVGRNGEGKSTLLKIMAGWFAPDAGDIEQRDGLKVSYLPQAVPNDITGSVYSIVAGGFEGLGQLLADYHDTSLAFAHGEASASKLGRLQDAIDARDGWAAGQQVEQQLSRLDLEADASFESLSGGVKRRVLLARALIIRPDVLLLDEPTNHLDVGTIAWLEEYLNGLNCSVVLITHDRAFLDAVSTRILELDRGQLTGFSGNFKAYREAKQQQLEVEAEQVALFEKRLAKEEAWIRQGIKARRTRNEGRVRRLEAMREEHRQLRSRSGNANLDTNQAARSGKRVFEAEDVSVAFEGATVIRNLSVTVQRQDRLGIIGPNGCGKSTLVKLLLGEIDADTGTVYSGSNVQVAYFDQLRAALNLKASAADNVSDGADTVLINGQQRHIMSYMQDFLFTPAKARAPIDALSGGETSRLLLAKLFLKPANVLVFDEPSNDLDIETLELLESLLAEYEGTVILISHDRELLDNVVTRSLVFRGNGRFSDVAGGYADMERELGTRFPWLQEATRAKGNAAAIRNGAPSGASKSSTTNAASDSQPAARKPIKLNYKDQRELDGLPDRIDTLETALASLQEKMSLPENSTDADRLQTLSLEASALDTELKAAYTRWEQLDAKSG